VNLRAPLAIVISLAFAGSGISLSRPQSDTRTDTHAAPSHPCTLRIHVDGFRNTRGNLGTVVFRSHDGWPEDKQKAFRHGPAPIDTNTSTAVAIWPDLPPGDYAVAAIHDENSNARLDRNMIGIPKEGFGFANNPHVGFSAPPFEQAVVHVACPETDITIHLQYR
jgi:uncharacterized protein (DUF2141 family)